MLSRSVMARTSRWTTVLVTITAWMLLSNHCALGLGGTAVELDAHPGGCPMHSAPGEKKPATNLLCCKDLRAVATHAAKRVAALATQLVGTQNYVTTTFPPPPRLTAPVLALDTGPPHSLSFAESILQRSVLAHAPPPGFARL